MARGKKKGNLTPEERLQAALVPDWEQPYKVPENWCWVRIDAISKVYTGNSISKKIKEEKYMGISDGLVYMATKDISFDFIINYDTGVRISDWKNYKVAPKYSTLLCIEGGSAGRKIGFLTHDVCFVNKLCAFVPNSYINPKYLFYVLQSPIFKQQFEDNMHGLIGGVSVTEISSFSVPFPSLKQQNQMVEQIEGLFDKLDEAKQKVQNVLDSFEIRKATILHKALSGEFTVRWRKEHNVGIESWKTVSVSEVCHSLKYGTEKKSASEGTVVVIRMGNLQDGEIDWSDLAYSNDKEDIEKYKLVPGDVLFNRTNSPALVGKTSIYRGEYPAIYAGYLIKLDYDRSRITGDYLNYSLNTIYAKEYCNSVKTDGVNQSNINAKKIGAYKFAMPNIEEQTEIIRILDDLFAKEQQVKKAAEAVLEQIDLIKKSILARAFRGELSTNDHTEESAVELVKDIVFNNIE